MMQTSNRIELDIIEIIPLPTPNSRLWRETDKILTRIHKKICGEVLVGM